MLNTYSTSKVLSPSLSSSLLSRWPVQSGDECTTSCSEHHCCCDGRCLQNRTRRRRTITTTNRTTRGNQRMLLRMQSSSSSSTCCSSVLLLFMFIFLFCFTYLPTSTNASPITLTNIRQHHRRKQENYQGKTTKTNVVVGVGSVHKDMLKSGTIIRDATTNGVGMNMLLIMWGGVLFVYLLTKWVGMNVAPLFGQGGNKLVMICGILLGGWVLLNVWHSVMVMHALSLLKCGQYFIAGGLCAFVTHAACVPIDVVKTRLQLERYQGRYQNMADAFVKIIKEEGVAALGKGLGATAWGYFLHGAFKYCGYEVFKVVLSEDGGQTGSAPGLGVSAGAGFLAECVACLLLCPMEAIRIRSVADGGFPQGVVAGLRLIAKTEGVIAGLYKGLPSILLKQVPYTVGQFVSYEFAVVLIKFIAMVLFGIGAGGSKVPTSYVPIFATIAGFLAGIMAAIISHPGDTILSKVNQEASFSSSSSIAAKANNNHHSGDDNDDAYDTPSSAWSNIVRVAGQQGFRGLFLGLGARLLQVSCIVGGQFLIYDSIKLWCGILPASALPSSPVGGMRVAPPTSSTVVTALKH